MNCIDCSKKSCRKGEDCRTENFDSDLLRSEYYRNDYQKIIQAAASLVDNGRAGTLSRIREIIEFIKKMEYKKVGLAYCYGMEEEAKKIKKLFREDNIKLSSVSCTVGSVMQDEINTESCIHRVSCNPIGQASQLNSEETDFVLILGICLGHDLLLQRNLNADFTTVAVKDRIFNHNPLMVLEPQLIPEQIDSYQN